MSVGEAFEISWFSHKDLIEGFQKAQKGLGNAVTASITITSPEGDLPPSNDVIRTVHYYFWAMADLCYHLDKGFPTSLSTTEHNWSDMSEPEANLIQAIRRVDHAKIFPLLQIQGLAALLYDQATAECPLPEVPPTVAVRVTFKPDNPSV